MALKHLLGLGCQNQRLTVYTVYAIISFANCTEQPTCKPLYAQKKNWELKSLDEACIPRAGFGVVGMPENLIRAVRDSGPKALTVVSNEAG